MNRFWGLIKSRPIVSTILVILVAGFFFMYLSSGGRSYEYVTQKVTRGEVVRVVSASGTLRALNTINVGAEVSGQITDVFVDFNSPVEKGQLLAQIDPIRVRAQVTQARAQVLLAQASLAQAEAAISGATTDVEVQQREYDRRKELSQKGFVSGGSLDQAQNALVAAKASLSTAQAQAQSARAQIAQSTAQLRAAELDLSRTRIIAPTSGVVIDKLVEPGTTVAANFQTPNLFTIAADTSRMQVEAAVDEADIGQVREGQDVRFSVDSYPNQIFEAKVGQIRKSATQSGSAVSYLVILDVDNSDGQLLTGMTANVDIITGRRTDAIRVPIAATRFLPREEDREEENLPSPEQMSQETSVWLPGEDPFNPSRHVIELGLEGEEFAEVVSGLKEGQAILVRSREASESE
ncbi:MAG: efflux RND transporter periplasmic adaptor subunit [Erythrobacter sp.]|uniref:efflux RND transporter periplasmic adaptor subunit n=1 Tax=Erythrobacter sp. TaxID=1042 RepID=UPI00261EDFFD|nr:efflux RND transporter periplasmic adaptor subunit [Erythrobacter sp.]MDJ0977437.1 efflux RND transporter periplasmic adaptor subunit [Erythrobacter sp.]